MPVLIPEGFGCSRPRNRPGPWSAGVPPRRPGPA